MTPDRDKIPYQTSIKSILLNVVKQAQADGIISSDESELINRIQIDARELETEIAKAKSEGLSPKEVYLVARKRIVENATETAKLDGIITKDEEEIIKRLIAELDKLEVSI